MRRVAVLLWLGLVLGALLWWAPSSATAQVEETPLYVTAQVTYDVQPDVGPVRVRWDVTVRNQDPSTTWRPYGLVYYYATLTLPVLKGASAVQAWGPGGVPLTVTVEDLPSDHALRPIIATAQVHFSDNLFYGETYQFSLSYEVSEIRGQWLIVSPYYVFLPAFGFGNEVTVSVHTPTSAGWEDVVDGRAGECEETAAQVFSCTAPATVVFAAMVEATQPTSLLTRDASVTVGEDEVTFQVRYFPGEEAWAERAAELVQEALPVLEEIVGSAYPGPSQVEIGQRGQRGLAGYEGLFECVKLEPPCRIGVAPVADDYVILHELAHFWTGVFRPRWLEEGFAEFVARRAAERLQVPIPTAPDVTSGEPFPLEMWVHRYNFLTATEEQRAQEQEGYQRSLQVFDLLAERVGLEGLQAAYGRAAASTKDVDSRRYLDILEEVSGERVDRVFADWVFNEATVRLLDERRVVRDRFERLQTQIEAAGLEVPDRLVNLLDAWLFDTAGDVIGEAEEALRAYRAAQETVQADRSWWVRFGLWGSDPEGTLAEAADAFNRGAFDNAKERAEAASALIEGAGRVALVRLLIGLGGVGGALAVSALLVWWWRRWRARRRAARSV